MKKLLTSILVLMITGAPIASAQDTISIEETFDSIFASLITPVDSGRAEWKAVENIKGVNWYWPLNQRNQHKFRMKGTVGGYMDVEIYGCGYYDLGKFTEPPCIGEIHISFAYGENFPNAESIFIDHLNDHLTKIPTTCNSDSAMHEEAFYEWVKPGYTPLYIYYVSSFGSRMGSVDYNIGYVPDDILHPHPCEVLQ